MELTLPTPLFVSIPKIVRSSKPNNHGLCLLNSIPLSADMKLQGGRRTLTIASSLPETAASVAIAATVVGAAATFLSRRNKDSEAVEAYVRNAKVKVLCLRNCQMKMQSGRGWLRRIWPLDSPQRFLKNGVTVPSALLLDLVVLVVAVGP
ncbi:uncharacterized protein LOC103501412 isoform X4 [Cucumis melo]|uniref:Uncharacterized protein LOC103501412 isoform X4 n=1 Tax=Cucumis melo TaxID=3656 RepID=A0ABM3KF68_CUCME|nr:uncharacterized protein LOC103501412 isoform X4 [Cucumis melo]